MTAIPDDIMKAAREIAASYYDGMSAYHDSDSIRSGKRDHWGEVACAARALMAERERSADNTERLRKAFEDMIMMVDFEKRKITIAFETAEQTEEAQQALSEAIGSEAIGEKAW